MHRLIFQYGAFILLNSFPVSIFICSFYNTVFRGYMRLKIFNIFIYTFPDKLIAKYHSMKISKLKQIKSNLIIVCTMLSAFNTAAQSLSVNTTGATAHSSALLDVSSVNKGMLIPRVSLTGITDVATIVAPATSLLIYNTNAAIAGGSGAGYYYYSGTQWVKIIDAVTPGNSWSLTGNSGTTAGINFIGTTDSVSLVFKVNNNNAGKIDVTLKNAGFGEKTLLANTTGTGNTAVGF